MSKINFEKTIAGFNITERGVRSYSKSFQLGPIQVTVNARQTGLFGSVSLPGTGLSKQNIKLF
jgi:hypothetical protein